MLMNLQYVIIAIFKFLIILIFNSINEVISAKNDLNIIFGSDLSL